jgi:hypothetical protein
LDEVFNSRMKNGIGFVETPLPTGADGAKDSVMTAISIMSVQQKIELEIPSQGIHSLNFLGCRTSFNLKESPCSC